VEPDDEDTFANYQTSIMKRCRAIVVTSSDMNMAMNSEPDELGPLAKKVTDEYTALANDGAYAMALSDSPEVWK